MDRPSALTREPLINKSARDDCITKVNVRKVQSQSETRKRSTELKLKKSRSTSEVTVQRDEDDLNTEAANQTVIPIMNANSDGTTEKRKMSDARAAKLQLINIPPEFTDPQLPAFLSDLPTPVQPYPPARRNELTVNSPITSAMVEANRALNSAGSQPGTQDEVIQITVFFSDEQGLEFSIRGGRCAQAQFILNLVAHERLMDSERTLEAFTLWMVSPLLEVQLKAAHYPYEVRRCWPQLLKKYTDADSEGIVHDEPTLVMKRCVPLSVEREVELRADPKICAILFEDARKEFLDGRYMANCETSATMAGLSMHAVLGDREKISSELVRKEIHDHLPEKWIPSVRGAMVFGRTLTKTLSGSTLEMEKRVIKAWEGCKSKLDAMNQFLDYASQLPAYGSAFFSCSIERPPPSLKDVKSWFNPSGNDIKVSVGVSRDYINVFDANKGDILLIQQRDLCKWKKVDPKEDGAEPSLLIHFPDDLPDQNSNGVTVNGSKQKVRKASKKGETKLLQIFGPQTIMIDALLESIEHIIKDEQSRRQGYSSDEGCFSGGSQFDPTASVTSSEGSLENSRTSGKSFGSVKRQPSVTKGNRMCLATFDKEGKCTDASGSLKIVLQCR